jgi:hypothetical protein
LVFTAADATGAFGVMQNQNCVCVDDFAIVDHCQRFIERRLQDFNIFAFVLEAALAAKKVNFSALLPGFMLASKTRRGFRTEILLPRLHC